jgi:hypothetical protein
LQEIELSKVEKIASVTPKRRRMASVLEAVIESVKVSTPASTPTAEGKIVKGSAEAGTAQAAVEAGPSTPAEARPSGVTEESAEARPSEATEGPSMLRKEGATEESEFPALGAPSEELDFNVCHASGKNYQMSKLPKRSIMPGIYSTLEGPWCLVEMMKMTSFIVYLTIKRFMSVGRWQTM